MKHLIGILGLAGLLGAYGGAVVTFVLAMGRILGAPVEDKVVLASAVSTAVFDGLCSEGVK